MPPGTFTPGFKAQALAIDVTRYSSSAFRQPHQLISGWLQRAITAPLRTCLQGKQEPNEAPWRGEEQPPQTSPAHSQHLHSPPPCIIQCIYSCIPAVKQGRAFQITIICNKSSDTEAVTRMRAVRNRRWLPVAQERLAQRGCRGAGHHSARRSGCGEQPVPVDGGSSGGSCGSQGLTSRIDGCALGHDYRQHKQGVSAARGKLPVVLAIALLSWFYIFIYNNIFICITYNHNIQKICIVYGYVNIYVLNQRGGL